MTANAEDLLNEARAGGRRAIARLISLAEAGSAGKGGVADDVLARVYQAAGAAHVIGVTGPPGAGKSTLVNALVRELRAAEPDRRVGVLAIDPSSPFSGGAILGDRVRMADLSGDDGVFIRSLATQGALGGLARPALDVVDVLDACGFRTIVIETVGVGQDEVDIATAAHTVLVASPPGLGDGIQAMKAGILEIADIHVVTKGDRPDADRTAADLAGALEVGLSGRQGAAHSGWSVPVVPTSAQNGSGIADLAAAVADHRAHLAASGEEAARRRRIAAMRLDTLAQDLLRRRLRDMGEARDGLVDDLAERRTDPREAVAALLGRAFRS